MTQLRVLHLIDGLRQALVHQIIWVSLLLECYLGHLSIFVRVKAHLHSVR